MRTFIVIMIITLSGCSEGITTMCDDVVCNFNNTSNENISICGYIALTPKNGALNIKLPSDRKVLEMAKDHFRQAMSSGTDEQLLKNDNFMKAAPKLMTNERMAFSNNKTCSGAVRSGSNSQIIHNAEFGFGTPRTVSDLCNGNGCKINFVSQEKLVSITRKQF